MTGFEKLIHIIRKEINKCQKKEVRLGVMENRTDCRMGDILLDKDDYIIAERLKGNLRQGDEVVILVLSNEQYIIIEKVVNA